jgi:hypothetical protein
VSGVADHTITIAPHPQCEHCQSDNPADWCEIDPWTKRPRRCLSWTIACPGVTAHCRTWWECRDCNNGDRDLEEHLEENAEAHGIEHQYLPFGWATPSDDCSYRLDDAYERIFEAVRDLEQPVGIHVIKLTWEGDLGPDVTIKAPATAGGDR